ncbi:MULTISPECIES: YhcN/YlaJ family sporulation lipoprotein [Bacillaceae]|uniref:YhcN/YlaJ family sporulation lipoprotein n=1 Tax=Bacillaceae TaxID=186817 RepID=UPI00118D071E|nr:YhcN/YlaJ family sporulation lipoprotein [Bacillus sp. S3]QCJ41788.1 sporulation protein [Bacillus sp. S3]
MATKYRLFMLLCLLLLAACNHNDKEKDSRLALVKTTNPNPVMTDKAKNSDGVEEIKKEVSSLPELYDVAVVKGKKDTLVVYKVKHLHRFKMKKIEKNVSSMLKEKYPKEKFTVSSDYKIFLETVRLNERMESAKFTRKEAEKRFKEIVKMTEDLK